jgi:hypothetical protein
MHLNQQELHNNIKKVDHVIYGPWVGELGWELFGCQGYLRKLREDYTHIKSFHIISRTGRSFLYEDFCDSYIEFDCPGHNITGALCLDWKPDKQIIPSVTKSLGLDNYLYIPTQHFLVDYHAVGPGREERLEKFLGSQKFIKYENNNKKDKSYDVLIHARHSFHHNTGKKNWPKEKWDELSTYLVNKGYIIAATGSKKGAYLPKHCDDLRGIDLSEDISYLNQCKLFVSTCSGPAHLASLCGTPLVVITDENNINRYKTDWNPFNIPREIVYEEGWNPSVNLVISKIEKML